MNEVVAAKVRIISFDITFSMIRKLKLPLNKQVSTFAYFLKLPEAYLEIVTLFRGRNVFALELRKFITMLTLRFSGSPTKLRIKAAHRRVRGKRLLRLARQE